MNKTQETSLQILRAKIRSIADERERIKAPELAKELIADYSHLEWFEALKDEMFSRAIYNEVVSTLNKQRTAVIPNQKSAEADEDWESRLLKFRSKHLDRFEWTGLEHRKIGVMTRSDILGAADARRERGEHNLQFADYWSGIAERMDSVQTFEDIATSDDIGVLIRLGRND